MTKLGRSIQWRVGSAQGHTVHVPNPRLTTSLFLLSFPSFLLCLEHRNFLPHKNSQTTRLVFFAFVHFSPPSLLLSSPHFPIPIFPNIACFFPEILLHRLPRTLNRQITIASHRIVRAVAAAARFLISYCRLSLPLLPLYLVLIRTGLLLPSLIPPSASNPSYHHRHDPLPTLELISSFTFSSPPPPHPLPSAPKRTRHFFPWCTQQERIQIFKTKKRFSDASYIT